MSALHKKDLMCDRKHFAQSRAQFMAVGAAARRCGATRRSALKTPQEESREGFVETDVTQVY